MLNVLRRDGGEPSVEVRAEDAVPFDYLGAAQAAGSPAGGGELALSDHDGAVCSRSRTPALPSFVPSDGAARVRGAGVVGRAGKQDLRELSVMIQQRMGTAPVQNVGPGRFFPARACVLPAGDRSPRAPLAAVDDQALFAGREGGLRHPAQDAPPSLGDASASRSRPAALAASGIAAQTPEELSVASWLGADERPGAVRKRGM